MRRIIAFRLPGGGVHTGIGHHLGIARSTVRRVPARYKMPKPACTDQATGLPVGRPKPHRHEADRPRQLVHVDVKKLGRIPGCGWRIHGSGSAQDPRADSFRGRAARGGASPLRGYRYLHHAVDDHSRLVCSEILNDEKRQTAAGFWNRANAFSTVIGVTVEAVMIDNGSGYRSGDFKRLLDPEMKTSAHQTSTPADERESRTLQPNPYGRMGLRQALLQRCGAGSLLRGVPARMQSSPSP